MESILTTVKKACNVVEEYDAFDDVLIMYTNSVFFTLTQLGIGPPKGFAIESEDEEWSQFLSEDEEYAAAIPTYVGSKVRLMFDPPSNSTLLNALKQTVDEFEWRLNVAAENKQ